MKKEIKIITKLKIEQNSFTVQHEQRNTIYMYACMHVCVWNNVHVHVWNEQVCSHVHVHYMTTCTRTCTCSHIYCSKNYLHFKYKYTKYKTQKNIIILEQCRQIKYNGMYSTCIYIVIYMYMYM